MDAPSLVSAWNALVLQLSYVFTEPTARTWQQLVWGWLFKRGRMTVTGMFSVLGNLADRHWTVYQKFFYRASWTLTDLSVALLNQVLYPLIIESGVLDPAMQKPVANLALDDTTLGRGGRHVAHAGWFKDASAVASHQGTVIHWAHNWLVGVVTLRLSGWTMRWVFPALFTLYRKKADCPQGEFQTRQELAGAMIQTAAAVSAQTPSLVCRYAPCPAGNFAA